MTTLEADSGYYGRAGKDIDKKRVWSGGRTVFDVLFFLEWNRSYTDIHFQKIHWAVSCFVHFLVLCGCIASVLSESLWPYGHSSPGSSVHGILQEWRNPPGDLLDPGSLLSPALAGSFFTTSTTWQAPSSAVLQWKKLNYKSFRAHILPPLSLS